MEIRHLSPAGDSTNIAAVDVHAHFGVYANSKHDFANQLMSGDASTVARYAGLARAQFTVVSPLRALTPRGHGDVLGGNEAAGNAVRQTAGLLQWVVIDPCMAASFEQAARMLEDPKCVGIKIHPEEHLYPIAE